MFLRNKDEYSIAKAVGSKAGKTSRAGSENLKYQAESVLQSLDDESHTNGVIDYRIFRKMLSISLKHRTECSWKGRLEVGIPVKAKGNTASELVYREKKTG